MVIIHTETNLNNVSIPKKEWTFILEKLKEFDDIKIKEAKEEKRNQIKGKGIFKQYANHELIENEKEAWAEAAVKKYENR